MPKIAPLILNSGKRDNNSRQVFIAQPDAIKENAAGKLFVLFEADGRGEDLSKVADFLIANLHYHYYENEKINLLGEFDDIRPENIFETALAKTNSEFWEWINSEKLSFNPSAASITVGIVYNQELYFSSFGKNRAILIFKKNGEFEAVDLLKGAEKENSFSNKLFSAVISGELPPDSCFLLSNEALTEYLSQKELINIITKLPPIGAAEQIKNRLMSINTYVPFLAVIIKNSNNLSEARETQPSDNLSAHASMNTLNYTEAKTEKLLSPVGMVNFKKVWEKISQSLHLFRPNPVRNYKTQRRIIFRHDDEKSPLISPLTANPGKINIPKKSRNYTYFKNFLQISKNLFLLILSIIGKVPQLFKTSFWHNYYHKKRNYFLSLPKNQKMLAGAALACILVLVVSIPLTNSYNKKQTEKKEIESLINGIKEKEDQIDQFLLYNNQDGAKIVISKIEEDLAALRSKKYDDSKLKTENERYEAQLVKIAKVTVVTDLKELIDLNSIKGDAQPEKLYYKNDTFYLPDLKNNLNFKITKNQTGTTQSLSGLNSPLLIGTLKTGELFYLGGNKIAKIDLKTGQAEYSTFELKSGAKPLSLDTFKTNFYIYDQSDGQVYRYTKNGQNYGSPATRLNQSLNSGEEAVIAISKEDGSIFLAKRNGEILKYYDSERQELNVDSVYPQIKGIAKIILAGKKLYLLEAETKRLIVYSLDNDKKKLTFTGQYRFDSLPDLKDLEIDNNGLIYILSGTKIFQGAIK